MDVVSLIGLMLVTAVNAIALSNVTRTLDAAGLSGSNYGLAQSLGLFSLTLISAVATGSHLYQMVS